MTFNPNGAHVTPLDLKRESARRRTLQEMTQEKWNALSHAERDRIRDLSGLTPQLTGLEGYRVEVVTTYGEKQRFIVSRSTGWRPCHICLSRVNSSGGMAASREYKSVRKIRKER